MSIFNNNITNSLPKSIRAKQEAIECVQRIVDRVNNDFGSCRVNPSYACDLFFILQYEIMHDNKEHKMNLKECLIVSTLLYTEHINNKSKDPEKRSGEFKIEYTYIDDGAVVRSSVWVPVELYKYPKW